MNIRFRLARHSEKVAIPTHVMETPIPPNRGDVVKLNGHLYDVVQMIHEIETRGEFSVVYVIVLKVRNGV